jgi:sugar O-acyltransferase (sialic acid O-acetyltransferase NeuD family)
MIYLIGAGGHAKVLADILEARNKKLVGYVDPKAAIWLEKRGVPKISEEELADLIPNHSELIIGFVGLDCVALAKRLKMLENYTKQGAGFPSIIHPSAVVSPYATIAQGVQIFPNAVVNSYAIIEEGAVINSGAVVEHDAHIESGVHIAPRATVLGGAKVGSCAYIGSGAVIIQNAVLAEKSFVKAGFVHAR